MLKGGADFAEVAKTESEDPGSAQRGGGVMVAEFDSVAFALADGQISEPFETAFGYHIIKRYGHRDVEPLDQAREKLMALMARDGRVDEPRKARLAKLASQYGFTRMKANSMTLRHRLSNLPADSAVLATVATD